eukprot:gene12646-12774_t
MRINVNTCIQGEKVVLWMQDPALQAATASEPLSLAEEYDMQRKWAEDEDKCTFILLDRSSPDTAGTGSHGGGMIGDVNFFFNDHDDHSVAEIEIMVAEAGSRRRGLATEALMLFMAYGISHLGITKFRAKIGESNIASVALFQKLGYKEVSRSSVFREVTLELPVNGQFKQQLAALASGMTLADYDS